MSSYSHGEACSDEQRMQHHHKKKRTQYESDLQRAQDASHEHVMDRMYGQALGCDWLMGFDGCNNQD